MVKNLPANAGDSGDVGLIPGWGRSPKKEMAIHSSILAWKIPRTEEPGRLQSTGLQRSWTQLSNYTTTTTPALRCRVLATGPPGESPGQVTNLIILYWIIIWGGGCPMHCKMFSSTPGLNLLDARSNPLQITRTKSISRHCRMPPHGWDGIARHSETRGRLPSPRPTQEAVTPGQRPEATCQ